MPLVSDINSQIADQETALSVVRVVRNYLAALPGHLYPNSQIHGYAVTTIVRLEMTREMDIIKRIAAGEDISNNTNTRVSLAVRTLGDSWRSACSIRDERTVRYHE